MSHRFDLTGKSALVTGGGRGLGRAMAIALAEAGADVAVAGRSLDTLNESCAAIAAIGRRSLAVEADVADLDAARNAVDRTVDTFGQLDILITAAGLQLRKPALDVTPEDWDRITDVNLRSVYFTCQYAAKAMQRRERPADGSPLGKIINIASLTSQVAWPEVSIYTAAKGGIQQMTKAMAMEWGPLGICVNAIAPGSFKTDLTKALYNDPARSQRIIDRIPLGRPGDPEDLAGSAVFLASPASDYITGTTLFVDGGLLLLGHGI
jgi:NAD(P)-dependent dehydrogenase (short-subunit alcohol dehydrogenase family)